MISRPTEAELMEWVREHIYGGMMIDAADWRHNRLEYEAIYQERQSRQTRDGQRATR